MCLFKEVIVHIEERVGGYIRGVARWPEVCTCRVSRCSRLYRIIDLLILPLCQFLPFFESCAASATSIFKAASSQLYDMSDSAHHIAGSSKLLLTTNWKRSCSAAYAHLSLFSRLRSYRLFAFDGTRSYSVVKLKRIRPCVLVTEHEIAASSCGPKRCHATCCAVRPISFTTSTLMLLIVQSSSGLFRCREQPKLGACILGEQLQPCPMAFSVASSFRSP
jgi:hypothetical protein